MPTLTIDNQQISVPKGASVLAAAEQLGIVVPHFCYHKALGAVGACRMCAVTVVEGSQKGLKMSCLIPAEEGMVVTTGDERSTAFRARVTEWLMINHPHDCPVCDEGGECQLQEMTIAGGHGIRRYGGKKRTYDNQELGPFITQEMNRCIQCYRCARTYQDYCGGRDFGVQGSRNRVFFGRFTEGMLESDFSGNLVDVCPTGVFTDKTYRFKTRYWDLQEAPSICPHCSLGCATVPGGRFRELQRVRSGVNSQVNGHFICDRGRFGSSYVNHPERPRQAQRRGEGMLRIDEALQQLKARARQLIAENGPDAVLLLGSERASLEANWLLQQWARQLGAAAPILGAHGPRQRAAQVAATDLSARLASLEQLRNSDLVVVFGADPLAEAPMLAVALRQVIRQGGQVMIYDPRPVELPWEFDHTPLSRKELLHLLSEAKTAEGDMLRELLQRAERPVLVGGGDLLGAAGLRQLNRLATELTTDERPCLVHPLLAGPNSFGVALLSPTEPADLLSRLESGLVKQLICLETDPLLEAPQGERFANCLAKLEELVVFDHLPTPLSVHASLFLPTATPVETAGSFINNEGRLQAFAPVIEPGLSISETGSGDHPPREFVLQTPGSEPRPAWRMLQQLLGDSCELAEVRQRMVAALPRLNGLTEIIPGDEGVRVASAAVGSVSSHERPEQPAGSLELLVSPAAYGGELYSRFSAKLAPRFAAAELCLNPQDATERRLEEGQLVVLDCEAGSFSLSLALNGRLALGCALVQNSAALPQLIPGCEARFCQVGPEVKDA